MNKFSLNSGYKKFLGDTLSPVSIYLKIRDKYSNSILLESSDYHGDEHSLSYICCDPISKFEVDEKGIYIKWPNGKEESKESTDKAEALQALTAYRNAFSTDQIDLPFITEGIFGYSSYNAVQYFEDIDIQKFQNDSRRIPEMLYQVYRYIIVYDHFDNEVFVIENRTEDQETGIDEVIKHITKPGFATYSFQSKTDETSNLEDEEYREMVKKGIAHCQRGDVFQIVLSRRFQQDFEGDEFNVYRTLRSINPSPYLFYFDFGKFKLFGSSPEAQIVIEEGKATIHPIAGTFKRTGNDRDDFDSAKKLFDDPKENSEHVMLVDLARNDLSRHGFNVEVDTFKEIQYYSHVIHLVSKVTSEMDEGVEATQLFADTFPAGTLSGAPKHMAMTLIDKYEKDCRGYYGGAIGHMSFNGNLNHAIMIRTFMSKDNTLFYQAGAGVVAKSDPESELQEVNNKLGALKKAIQKADEIFQ